MNIVMRLFQRNGWYYAGFRRGQEKALGTKDAVLATELYRGLKEEYLRGKLFQLDAYKKITLNEFRKTYIEKGRAGMAAKTIRQDDLSLRLLEDVIGGSTQLRAILKPKIDEFIRACLARKVKPRSVNSYLRHIKAAFTYAIDTGYIEKKPKIKLVKVGDSLPHVLSPEQIQALLETAKEADIDLWRYFMACLWTGARRSEVLGLTWQAISIQKRQCTVTGKGNRERIVPLLPPLIEMLEPIKKDMGPVFPQEHADTYTHKFKRIALSCGIEAHHLHDLRHTAATFMLKNGVPLAVVQKILGHSQISTTQIYAQVLDEMMQIEMSKLRFE
jgi:site-specific recombinase XerD